MAELVYALRDALDKAEAERDRWCNVAQSITPGGSEYFCPDYIAAFIRQFRQSTHEAKKNCVLLRRERDALNAENERLRDVLQETHDDLIQRAQAYSRDGTTVAVGAGVWMSICKALQENNQ
jgi:hypothetical protein